ncbi:hypothetical protein KL942_005176 [Ogataea angusta]|uniref:Zn(2)-C6 fungal-type domain-containing protein n=1 Tax=Pichia angusta TaxID=870730 RepID=A0ABQ7RQ83_PICAN|nr:hypothetical protein KL942_005176 [Ogataea angusta]KAG7845736.1 hypothetical protein KL940_005136 [Ogataea angusta]
MGPVRSKTACQKCRSLKHKCDFKYPRCSRCGRLGVECMVLDSSTRQLRPRADYPDVFCPLPMEEPSIRMLEKRVELLEDRLAKYASIFESFGAVNSPSVAAMSHLTVLSMIPFRSSSPTVDNELTKISIYGKIDSNQPLDRWEPLPPSKVECEQLISNYYQIAWIQHPIVEDETILYKLSSKHYQSPDSLSHWELFVLYITLAIGTAITGDMSDKSQSFYLSSIVQLKIFLAKTISPGTDNRDFSSQMQILQSLLLICCFGLLKPVSPGIWYVIANAMRLCIDMDLHEEHVVKDIGSSYYRRLFWCCYALDRQICCYVNKPFGLNDTDITTNLDEVSVGEHRLAISSLFFKIRKLQSMIQQFSSKKALSNMSKSVANWRHEMHVELNSWLVQALQFENSSNSAVKQAFVSSKNFLILTYFQQLQRLYKPDNMSPECLTFNEFMSLFESSIKILATYEVLSQTRRINYRYLSVYSIYQSGLTVLYCFINCAQLRLFADTIEKLEHTMEVTKDLLQKLEIHCPPARSAMQILETVHHNTIEQVIGGGSLENKFLFDCGSHFGPFDSESISLLSHNGAIPLIEDKAITQEVPDTPAFGLSAASNVSAVHSIRPLNPFPDSAKESWDSLFEEPFNLKELMFD